MIDDGHNQKISPKVTLAPLSKVHENKTFLEDPCLATTLRAINWDLLLTIARDIYQAESASWGQQFNGGYNVVRFIQLCLSDGGITEIVARVPYLPSGGSTTDDEAAMIGNRISSEVATMEYIASHTSIPVPCVITHSNGNGVGSPYILMTKAEGVPLYKVWDDMEDGKREIILRQVVHILLQLSSVRFDGIGALMRNKKGTGKKTDDEWFIVPASTILGSDSNIASHQVYKSGVDYWLTYANAHLESIDNGQFGYVNKSYKYAIAWFLRSIIPSLIDPSLDTKGFPLAPGDFHSQNILVTDLDTPSPRITSVIDWEFTFTECTSTFAQFPFFIVDHPFWNNDHPMKARNRMDQVVFIRLMREAKKEMGAEGNLPLSRAYESCYGIYLFQLCLTDPLMFSGLYDDLFAHIFGKEDECEPFSVAYYDALHYGILKKETEKFKKEAKVKKEAEETLGKDMITLKLTRAQFKTIVAEHLAEFEPGGVVREWFATKDLDR